MNWTNDKISALVEPDRAHRKAYVDEDLFDLEMERILSAFGSTLDMKVR